MATEKFAEVSEHNRLQNMKLAATKASVPLIQLLVAMSLSFLVWLALSPDFLAEPVPVLSLPLLPLRP